MTETGRRTKRRYAHEVYPDASEGSTFKDQVLHLYGQVLGLRTSGTGWGDLICTGNPDKMQKSMDRIDRKVDAERIALLADALYQGMTGSDAWEWVLCNEGGDGVGDRMEHYDIAYDLIKPYPCGPEPDKHWHDDETGNIIGRSLGTYVDGRESECEACTEPIPADQEATND